MAKNKNNNNNKSAQNNKFNAEFSQELNQNSVLNKQAANTNQQKAEK